MKAIWKGDLSFGLVSIPIKLYSAIKQESPGFTLLHAKCKTPLQYQRYCPHCKKVIPWENVVKGIKMPDGSYFVLTEEKLEEMKPERTNSIEVTECVDTSLISSIYYNNHYYVGPANLTEKAYFLFSQILEKQNLTAIAQVVFRDKEYVAAIQPYENGLLLSTLNYEYEIKPIGDIKELSVTVSAHVTKKEEKLAEELIAKMTKKKFDITQFKDTFAQWLREQIKRAAAGKKTIAKRAKKAVASRMKEISLVDTLEESIKKVKKTPTRSRARK
jgi:DNA end-binding protein Ku